MYLNNKSSLHENFSLAPTKFQELVNNKNSETFIKYTKCKYNPSNINQKKKLKPASKSLLAYVGQGLCFSSDVIDEFNNHTNVNSSNLLNIIKQPKGRRVSDNSIKNDELQTKFLKQNIFKVMKLKHFEKKCLENIWTKTKLGKYEKNKFYCSGIDKPNKSFPENTVQSYNKSKKSSVCLNEVLMKKLSKYSLRKIYESACTTAGDKLKLEKIINELFHLNDDNVSSDIIKIEEVDDEETRKIKMKILKDQQKLREKANKEACLKSDPNLVKTLAEYYLLPRSLKALGFNKVEHTELFNNTCENIEITDGKDSMSGKLKTKLNLKISSNHMLKSKNEYESKLLEGVTNQVYSEEKTTIQLQDDSKYKVKLQDTYPKDPREYGTKDFKGKTSLTKGALRWSSLPKKIDAHQSLMFFPNINEMLDFAQPKSDAEILCGRKIDSETLVSCIEMWRQKWSMSNRWHDLKLADILLDLNSIHDSVRLAAMATCLVASLYFIPNQNVDIVQFGRDIKTQSAERVWSETINKVYEECSIASISNQSLSRYDSTNNKPTKTIGHLPAPLLTKVSEMMTSDSHERVRLAACMCLHVCGNEELEVTEVLQYHIQCGLPSDQLVAGQIVALRGIPSTKVVQQMVNMLVEGDSEYEQASKLLIHLSQFTRLVHSLLAEQLNSSNYKVRAAVCNVLCQTRGEINHDLVNKLKKMMSQDWSSQVRQAAAQTLGRTGHGRAIHYDLRDKITKGTDRDMVDGLRIVAHIGIMTASLHNSFIKCFTSDYQSVRIEACQTAAKLKLKDDKVIHELSNLLTYDYSWKVKAHAIKAICSIGKTTVDVIKSILWSSQFDENAAVRLEAIHTLLLLKCNSDEVIRVLKNRLIVEENRMVKEEISLFLNYFNTNKCEDDVEIVKKIKQEVGKCCYHQNTAEKILKLERVVKNIKTSCRPSSVKGRERI